MNIKKTLKKADIQIKEFAVLCGVSRMSVHLWCDGRPINPLRLPRVEKLLAAIESAVAAKDFPISRPNIRGVDPKFVDEKIKSTVLKHLRPLTESR